MQPTVEPMPGDLLFVRGRDLVSREIEEVTHSTYSHVAIVSGWNELIEAQGLRKVGYQDAGAYAGMADVYRCDSLTEPDRKRMLSEARKHIGQEYDYLLLLWELARYTCGVMIPWHEHHTVICSTLVAGCLRSTGVDPCPGLRNPSPGDLALSPVFRRVGAFNR